MNKGFEPVWNRQCEILILGSFPSVLSRQKNFYYGHPQNRFWTTLKKIYHQEFGDNSQEKTEFLLSHKIALWDVYDQSAMSGSGDNEIKDSNSRLADVSGLMEKLVNLKKVLCNGRKAFVGFVGQCPEWKDKAEYLPSSSPANAARREENFKRWESALLN